MAVIEQQPYNLFAQQKRAGYPSSAQTPAESQPVEAAATPQSAAQPQAQAQPVVQQKPVAKAAGTVALQPGSSTAGMDYLNSLYTDPKEEERLRKASVMNQRILAIGDAVRHIGNIANTVNYAPAQQFNDPVAMEQARYEKGKTMRDKANQLYYTYQQQKAQQDAAQRKWEQQYGLQQANVASQHAYRQEQARIAAERAANQKAYNEGSLALKEKLGTAQQQERERHNKVAEKQGQQRIGLGWANHNLSREKLNYLKSKGTGAGGGSPYDFATPNGTITMPKNFSQTQKDQVIAKFDRYIDRSEMQRQMIALGLNTQDPAQVRNFQFAKMLQEHQDVADYVSEKFRGKQTFTSNPLARPEASSSQPMFQTPWGQSANAPSIGWDNDDNDEEILDDDDDNLIGW